MKIFVLLKFTYALVTLEGGLNVILLLRIAKSVSYEINNIRLAAKFYYYIEQFISNNGGEIINLFA